jgi:hypothetical protein
MYLVKSESEVMCCRKKHSRTVHEKDSLISGAPAVVSRSVAVDHDDPFVPITVLALNFAEVAVYVVSAGGFPVFGRVTIDHVIDDDESVGIAQTLFDTVHADIVAETSS